MRFIKGLGRLRGVIRVMAVATVAVCIASAASAQPIFSLKDLVDQGGSIQMGDKLFSNFSVTVTGVGTYNLDPAGVSVTGIVDQGDYGLSFTAPSTAPLFAAANSYGAMLIGFDVQVTDPNWYLNDIGLKVVGTVTGTGVASITETALLPDGMTAVGQVYVQAPAPAVNEAILSPKPGMYKKIQIVKDIKVIGGPNGTASIISFEQTFSQVPEPSSLIALGTGIIGLLGLRRKR